ncbi:unnamed protein product [Coffea canephora]|uniref:P-type ATPase A domain-containing protein n=1 Tax=Coffea canephora TaxID=49390 RepID=A0A068V6J1_COFCA|nr:unnamed protein product [Coffea canephora]
MTWKPGNKETLFPYLLLLEQQRQRNTFSKYVTCFHISNNKEQQRNQIILQFCLESEDVSILVPGDIISIKLVDIIPADARLLDRDPLKIDPSALTGESIQFFRSDYGICSQLNFSVLLLRCLTEKLQLLAYHFDERSIFHEMALFFIQCSCRLRICT